MSSEHPSRREAIARLVVLGTGLGLSDCAALGRGGGTEVAPVEAVPVGSALRTTVKEKPVILVNIEGHIRAFSGICTHESCELGWNQRQQLIRCPCHGSAFTPDGKVERGPAERALEEFTVRVRSGKVFLDL